MSDTQEKPALAGPVTYTLLVPVELRNRDGQVLERITQLTLDRFKAAAARRVINAKSRGEGELMAELVSAAARIPPSTVDQLDAEDLLALSEIAGGFFGSGQATS